MASRPRTNRVNLDPNKPPGSNAKMANQLAPAAMLTGMEWKFVENFLLTLNASKSALAAGYSDARMGYILLQKPSVASAIDQAIAFRSARTAVTVDSVVNRLYQIVTTDVNELASVIMVNCRFCWGDDGRYQFTAEEYRRARQKHMYVQLKKEPRDRREFDDEGGWGFEPEKVPRRGTTWGQQANSDRSCTECGGRGLAKGVVQDTTELSYGARMLYDGYRITRDGRMEVKTRDRNNLELALMRHLGMFRDREPIKVFDPSRMAPDELDAVINNLPPMVREQVEAMFENIADDPSQARAAGLVDITEYPEPPRRRQRVLIDDEDE